MKLILVTLVGLVLLTDPSDCSLTGQMAGDPNPPGYSVVNLDLDTIERPPSVDKSVMAYVNAADGMHLLFISGTTHA